MLSLPSVPDPCDEDDATVNFTLILRDRKRRIFLARHPGPKCLSQLRGGADVNAPNSPGERSSSFLEAAAASERTCSRFRYNSSSAKREDVSSYSWGRRVGIFFSNPPMDRGDALERVSGMTNHSWLLAVYHCANVCSRVSA